MASSTLILVRKAREGDMQARNALVERFYQDWIDKFHGDLGKTIRRLYDTEDLVQSAIADALRQLPSLRNESVFFSWVTSIIRHKIAHEKRRLRREVPMPRTGTGSSAAAPELEERRTTDPDDEITYVETLEVIIELFPQHAEEMTAVVLKLLDGRSIPEVARLLDMSPRSALRRLQEGLLHLKGRFHS